MNSNDCDSNESSSKVPISERWSGIVMTLISTAFFCVSHTMLRLLTEYRIDNDWILFFKESIGLLLLLPWLALRFFQGRYRFTSKRLILLVAFAAILCEAIGARLHVLGFAVIGLLITIPLVQSSTLLGTAFFGKLFLGDPVSSKRKIAMGILIFAVVLLSVGKEWASPSERPIELKNQGETVLSTLESSVTASENIEIRQRNERNTGYFLLVSAGTILAGIAYSIYLIILRFAIRKYWNDDDNVWLSFQFSPWAGYEIPRSGLCEGPKSYSPFPVTLMMSIVLGVGAGVFGCFLYAKYGLVGFYRVPDQTVWFLVAISGCCNLIGFFFQIQGLRMTTAVQASLIAISQMLVLSLIGCCFFNEPINLIVAAGLILTICGVFMSARPENAVKN